MSGCYKRPVGSISPPTCVHVCARARVCGCFWILGVDGRAVYEFLLQKQRGARSSSRQWHSLPSSMAATCFVKKKVKSAMVDPCPDCAVCRASTASATSSSRTPTTASLRTGSPTACLALPMPDPLPLLIPPPHFWSHLPCLQWWHPHPPRHVGRAGSGHSVDRGTVVPDCVAFFLHFNDGGFRATEVALHQTFLHFARTLMNSMEAWKVQHICCCFMLLPFLARTNVFGNILRCVRVGGVRIRSPLGGGPGLGSKWVPPGHVEYP